MLWGTLSASLSGNLFTGKDKIRAGECTIRAAKDTIGFLMLPHHLTIFEIQMYY